MNLPLFLNQKDFCYFTIKIGKRLSSALICQRPARAFLIFTVPSQIPYKQRLPSLIFANICLTILITRVFHRFFGMFIVCSYFLGFILKVLLSSFFLFFPFLCNVLSVSFYILSVFLIVFLERIMIMEYSCS